MSAWTVAAIAVAVVEAASTSQVRVVRYGDDRLTGITQVDVVVSTQGDIASCPVDRARVQQTTVDALRESRVKATVSEKASSWSYSVLVTTHSVAVGGSCASALGAELVAQVDGIPEADRQLPRDIWGSLLVGPLSLVRESTMIASPVPQHEGSLLATLRAQVAAIAARIGAANR